MSYWNYRLIKHTEKDGSVWYAMHEAYYEDGAGKPHMITEFPAGIIEEELKDVEWVLNKMLEATKKPILNFEDF
jgi:hypothetical protein